MNWNRSKKSNNRRSRKSKRGGAPKLNKVGSLSQDKASFAAKLGAFIVQNQDLKQINGNPEDGFNLTKKNKKVFGVLPFLHLNITENQFKKVLVDSKGNLGESVEKLCNSAQLEKTLKKVSFNCKAQSNTGVQDGLLASIVESINNRWNVRQNGRKVLNVIQEIQTDQVKMGIIPSKSINWCK